MGHKLNALCCAVGPLVVLSRKVLYSNQFFMRFKRQCFVMDNINRWLCKNSVAYSCVLIISNTFDIIPNNNSNTLNSFYAKVFP